MRRPLSKRDPLHTVKLIIITVRLSSLIPATPDRQHGTERITRICEGCGGTELLARRDEAPPYPARRQPGGPSPRGERRRAAVRPGHQGRHPDRGRAAAARL